MHRLGLLCSTAVWPLCVLVAPVAEQSVLMSRIIAGHPDISAIPKPAGAGEASMHWSSHQTCSEAHGGCFLLLFVFLVQVLCARCASISYCVDSEWLVRWLRSGCVPLAWGRCVVQSWRRGMKTYRIYWAPMGAEPNSQEPRLAPRSVTPNAARPSLGLGIENQFQN